MVGSGWLFSAQLTAKSAGNWAFLAWILANIVVMMVGLCLAKVASIYPVRGATTRSSASSHNSVFCNAFCFCKLVWDSCNDFNRSSSKYAISRWYRWFWMANARWYYIYVWNDAVAIYIISLPSY